MPGERGGWQCFAFHDCLVMIQSLRSDKPLEWAERMGLSLGHESCIAPKGKFLSFAPVRWGSSTPE